MVRGSGSALVIWLTLASTAWGMPTESASEPAPPAGSAAYQQAVRLVEAEDFIAAIPLLEGVVTFEPAHADAWSRLGYSRRKLGRIEAAFDAYARALDLVPDHRGANEYLGELYLQLGDVANARQRLTILERACPQACEERTELQEQISAFEAQHGSGAN